MEYLDALSALKYDYPMDGLDHYEKDGTWTQHTRGPWRIEYGDMEQYGETDTVLSGIDVVALGVMRQDAELIADAPLLLAEVKRLRQEIKDYDACLQNLWDNELIPDDTDIWDEVKELLGVD